MKFKLKEIVAQMKCPKAINKVFNQDSEWQKETMLIKRCQDSEDLRARSLNWSAMKVREAFAKLEEKIWNTRKAENEMIKYQKITRNWWFDVTVVSSWKGPELERALKVQLLEKIRSNLKKRLGLANANLFKNKSLIKPQDSR